jgi:hypothetical protein
MFDAAVVVRVFVLQCDYLNLQPFTLSCNLLQLIERFV